MNQYLIPANASRGKLIAGVFRPIDLGIFLGGVVVTLILLFALQNEMEKTIIAVITILPVAICALLVMPVPNYHNTLVFIQGAYNYYMERRVYLWKGWCQSYGDEESEQ